jgi:hypothetical protein
MQNNSIHQTIQTLVVVVASFHLSCASLSFAYKIAAEQCAGAFFSFAYTVLSRKSQHFPCVVRV